MHSGIEGFYEGKKYHGFFDNTSSLSEEGLNFIYNTTCGCDIIYSKL